MRLHAQTATIEDGFVYLPEEANWRDAYVQELTTLPNSKHDDQVDSTAQALAWIKMNKEPGIITYYKAELAALRAKAAPATTNEATVRICVPQSISRVQTIAGRHIDVAPNRTILVNEAVTRARSSGIANGLIK